MEQGVQASGQPGLTNGQAKTKSLIYSLSALSVFAPGLARAQSGPAEGVSWLWALFVVLLLAALAVTGYLALRGRHLGRTSRDWASFPQDNPYPVLRISSQGEVLFANQASEDLLSKWGAYPGGTAPPEVAEAAARVAAGGGVESLQLTLNRRVLSLSLSAVSGQDYVHAYARDITDFQRAQERLAASEANYRTIFDSAQDAIFLHDAATGQIVDLNRRAGQMFGYSSEKLRRLGVGDLSSGEAPFNQEGALSLVHRVAAGSPQVVEWHAKAQGGRLFWAEVSLKKAEINGRHLVVAVVRDISHRKENEKRLQLAARVIENTMEGLVVTDPKGNIQMVNPAFSAITGYSAPEVLGQNPRLLKSNRHEPEFYTRMWGDLMEKGQWQGEIWNRRKSGEAYPQWLTITAIADPQKETVHYLGMFHDITILKEHQERMERRAYHDPLTGLPNRLLLNDRLQMALARAQRSGRFLAVMFTDLDGFKQVNDSLGHAMGDLMLQQVAARLKASLRDEDTISRQGGDEFVIILPDLADAGYAEVAARRVLAAVAQPYELEGNPARVTISLGIAVYPADGEDSDTLLRRADKAMYQAKQEGKNAFRFWSSLDQKQDPADQAIPAGSKG